MSDPQWSIEYHKPRAQEHKELADEAYNKTLDWLLAKGVPFNVIMDEFVPLWVDGIFNAKWQGWHDYGQITAEQQLEVTDVPSAV